MPKQRRLNTEMKEEVRKLLELKANKQMVKTFYEHYWQSNYYEGRSQHCSESETWSKK